jgi:hypothetical protein
MSVQVKAAEVMASEVEKMGRAASTEPARTLSCNLARKSGRVPAQSLIFGAESGGAKPSRWTANVCDWNEIKTTTKTRKVMAIMMVFQV